MFDVTDEDEMMIELTQKMMRVHGEDRITIGFTMMKVRNGPQAFPAAVSAATTLKRDISETGGSRCRLCITRRVQYLSSD